jgi:hypothetical protein
VRGGIGGEGGGGTSRSSSSSSSSWAAALESQTDGRLYPRPEYQSLEQVLAQDPLELDGRTQRGGERPQEYPRTVGTESAEQRCDTNSEHKAALDEHGDHPVRCPRSHK